MMQSITPWRTAAPHGLQSAARVARGIASHASGHKAEDIAAAHYADRGCEVLERCWRSAAGEVDLILQDGAVVVFVEVKKAGSFDAAAARLSRKQMDRICSAALIYADRLEAGSLTEMRFDAALVDAAGDVQVIENAFGLN